MKRTTALILGLFLFLSLVLSNRVLAQSNVYLLKSVGGSSTVRGKISNTSPHSVTVESGGKQQEVASSNIKKITFSGEPAAMTRARDRLEAGRYNDCLAELAKIDDPPDDPLIVQEIDFFKAYSTAQIALSGGDISAKDGGSAISGFLKQHADSYRFFPATELLGRLLISFGRIKLAENEFKKLAKSGWSEFELKGHFYVGQCLLLQANPGEAKNSFEAINAADGTDDLTQQYKLLARCQLAKAMAMEGNTAQAKQTLEQIIKQENPDNQQLFAYAYNALGTCHLKSNELKPAAIAFLHTELLFSNEADAHAEALYNLAQIWPQLEHIDRANRAREALKSRYRNSYWVSKL